jgi:hypothetical protein
MATGAAMVSSKIFYALGYNVPESYIVYFDRGQIEASEGGEDVTSLGKTRDLLEEDIDRFLEEEAKDPVRGYRATATRLPAHWEGLLGPYQVYGLRSDDPNDIVPHEHRRDLRGLFVFTAWLDHVYMTANNTLDVLVKENDVPFIRHYLLDFVATLGSGAGGRRPKIAWEGNELAYDRNTTLKNIAGMGVWSPRWMRAKYPRFPSVGHFEYRTFRPDQWITDAQIAPFANRLPDDTYWGAKQVMAFSDDDIRALVSTGQYSNPEAEAWLAECLIERRNKIGETFFSGVLPLDGFRVEDGELKFEDLAEHYGFVEPRSFRVQWSSFDNRTEKHTNVGASAPTFEIPPAATIAAEGSYFAARIWADDPLMAVTVYLRKEGDGLQVVGIDRHWPGKVLATAEAEIDTGRSRYVDLQGRQKELFEAYTKDYNEETEKDLAPQEYFDSLPISYRTTYDAVTHALMNSKLTDEDGSSLGTALDLVQRVNRIAGQYYGRSGDEQFRIYAGLVPNAKETLDRSKEFFRDKENTVYHVGYPISFRQEGKVPNIQFSVSEDGSKSDIDVDYRSSKMPQAMFNGHLTAANSDVRAGDNSVRHAGRWAGFVDWWQEVFGGFKKRKDTRGKDILAQELPESPTPLPPDRPQSAEPIELHEAAQELLTDWLVRRKIDEALKFLSGRALACLDMDDDVSDELLRDNEARDVARMIMEYTVDELADLDNLTEAIDVVLPWDPTSTVVNHPFEEDFALVEMPNEKAVQYLCDRTPTREEEASIAAGDLTYGTYYAVIFRFKAQGGGVLGLLWMRENGKWRIVSYRSFQH